MLDLLEGPWARRGVGVRQQEIQRLAQAAAIACLVVPKVHTHVLGHGGQQEQGFQVEPRVAERGRALQLQRLLAIGLDLHGDALLLGGLSDLFCQVLLVQDQCQARGLHVVEGAMVVAGGGFVLAVGACQQPIQIRA